MDKYTFYVRYLNGNLYQETGLSKRQAVIRYNKFGKSQYMHDVKTYGWELER